jgi:uncharacterized membrane protein
MSPANLTFHPTPMPALLGLLCAAGLGAEVWLLVRRVRSGRALLPAAGWAAAVLALGAMALLGGPAGRVIVLTVLAVAWCVRAYGRTTSPVSARRRRHLLLLRLGAVGLVGLAGLRPTLRTPRVETTRPAVLVAVDATASMARKDAIRNGRSLPRLRAVREQFRDAAVDLDRLSEKAEVRLVALFDGQARTVEAPADLPAPAGDRTALGDAMRDAYDALAGTGRPVAAVVLVSDGCNNAAHVVDPVSFARRLGSLGVAVHTVLAGIDAASANVRSLSIESAGIEDVLPAFGRQRLAPTVRAVGLAGRTVRLTAQLGEQDLGSAEQTVTADDQRLELPIEFLPRKAGFHRLKLTAELTGKPGPSQPGPARLDRLVQVVDRDIRILYVEGRFRYEVRALARALAGVERFSLDRRILTQPLRDKPTDLPTKLEGWLGYHAVLLGDVAPDRFTPQQLRDLRDLVGEYGKGLGMIGGRSSFGAGGWQDTPLADVLPVDLARSAGQIDQPVKITPTSAGRDSPLMAIGPAGMSGTDAWAKLAPLPGANRLGPPKPAASVLADTVRNEPMIVAQRFGKGRSLAVAFDTTWRWVLSPDETADLQRRFWRQVATYLADPQPNAWLETSRSTYDADALATGRQEVLVTAGVEDSRGLPVRAEPTVTLTAPDGKSRPVTVRRTDRMFRAVLRPPTQPGVYDLTLSANVDGRTLRAKQRFEVVRTRPETDTPWADAERMRRIARASDGRAVTLGQLGELLRNLSRQVQPRRQRVVEETDLPGLLRWWWLLGVVGLLWAEWFLRKRSRLV